MPNRGLLKPGTQGEYVLAQLEAVFRAVSDGVAVFDLDGNAVLINDAKAKLNGFSSANDMRQDLAWYKRVFELLRPDGTRLPVEDWPLSRVMRGETLSNVEFTLKRTDTSAEWICSFSGSPVRNEQGKQILTLLISRDVTEQRMGQRRMELSEARFAQMFATAPFAMCLVNPGKLIVDVNPAWTALFERTREDALGKGGHELLHLDEAARARVWTEFQCQGSVRNMDIHVTTTSGRKITLSHNMDRFTLHGESYTLITQQDVTAQRDAEARVAEALRIRQEFLDIAGHELRTPLAALLMHLHSVQRTLSADYPPASKDRLQKAVNAGARLERLMAQMLDISRIEGGQLRLDPQAFDLNDLVKESVEEFTEHAARAGSTLCLQPGPAMAGAWDRVRVGQVLGNLLMNAIKYGSGNPVDVSVAMEDGCALLRVHDRGIGIGISDQHRIFDRFERAVAARDYGGFGLGLWISRQIVVASGGRVDVESAPGEGSTFTVRLPMTPEGWPT